jgi:MYXO-CTERM domain-containing protein
VSSESDKVGGQAFVTEYAKPTSELTMQLQGMFAPTDDGMKAKTAILDVLSQHSYITRLYARMSAEEMTVDPTFMVAGNGADVDNVHDLSDPSEQCSYIIQPPPPPPVDPCTFNYCGRRGVCVSASVPGQNGAAATSMPACACATDAVGRMTTTSGQPSTYCEPVAVNFDSAAPDGGAGVMLKAACEGVDCGGHGTCVAMNGNPSCQCDKGYGAVVSYASSTGTNIVSCQAVSGNIPPLPRLPAVGSTKISNDADGSGSSGGCNVARRTDGSSAAALAALAGLALVGARRRQRRG